jgi:hypothetical protein
MLHLHDLPSSNALRLVSEFIRKFVPWHILPAFRILVITFARFFTHNRPFGLVNRLLRTDFKCDIQILRGPRYIVVVDTSIHLVVHM